MTRYSALPEVLVDGEPLAPEITPRLASVEVDSRVGLPTMVVLELRDPERSVLTDAGVSIGASLEIRAGPVGAAEVETLATTEVTSLEAAYSGESSQVTVRAYDVSHRLHRGRRTRSYHDVTDGDIVRAVAEAVGLETGTIDDPGVVHAHVAQLNLSDWGFLRDRARASNRVLAVDDGRIELLEKEQATTAPEAGVLTSDGVRQLVLGSNVELFRGRVSSAELPAQVQARAWSPTDKRTLTSTAAPAATGTDIGLRLDDLVADHGSSVLVDADRAVETQEEVDALAGALAEAAGVGFATATAVCRGDPALVAGLTVSIGLAGDIFSGRWTVAAARHSFDRDGYRTRLHLGGASARSLLTGLTDAAGARAPSGPRLPATAGVAPAVVTDIADPDGLARVRVRLPWLSEDYVSDWVRVVHAGAGNGRGWVFLPEVDDEVLVAFEHGDPSRPYVVGGLFNGQDRPPLDGGAVDTASGSSDRRGVTSRSGHEIVLDDGTDAPGIGLVTAGGGAVKIQDTPKQVSISTDGDVTVEAGGTVTVSGRSLEVRGQAEIAITAPSISIEADGTLTLRGSMVNIN